MVRRWMSAAVLGAALLGCGGDDRDELEPGEEAVAPERRVETLTEAEALAILGAVHRGAGEVARAAQDSVRNPELRRLLRVIRVDHEALAAELSAIADSLEVAPGTHAAVLEVEGAVREAQLALSPGQPGFDEAVLRSEIALQEAIVTVLDSTVLPGTRQPLLAQYAAAARPTIVAHLQRAHQLEVLLREQAEQAAQAAARPSGVVPSTAAPRPTVPAPAPDTPPPTPVRPDTGAAPAPPDTTVRANR